MADGRATWGSTSPSSTAWAQRLGDLRNCGRASPGPSASSSPGRTCWPRATRCARFWHSCTSGSACLSWLRGVRLPRAFHFYLISVAAFVVYLYSYTPRLGAASTGRFTVCRVARLPAAAGTVRSLLHAVSRSIRPRVQPGASDLRACASRSACVQLLWMTGRLARVGLPRTANASMILDRIQLVYFCAGFIAGGVLLLIRRAARARVYDAAADEVGQLRNPGRRASLQPHLRCFRGCWACGRRLRWKRRSCFSASSR